MKKVDNNSISRRSFVRKASLAAAAVTAGIGITKANGHASAIDEKGKPIKTATGYSLNSLKPIIDKPLIGFQANATYLVEYGIGRFLDDIQNRANVNTLIQRMPPFEISWDGLDKSTNTNGNFVTANPKYYKNIYMQPKGLGPNDFNLPDAMQKIMAETKKRGMKIYPWVEEDNSSSTPRIIGMDKLYEIDLYGRRTTGHPGGPCLNNPYYRNLISGQIEDFIRTYDVDGLQRGSERQGPLSNALGAWHHGSNSDPGRTSCFCEYCTEKAAKKGIDVERVKKAFMVLEQYVKNGRAGKRPPDGYYVEFWRILLRNPELLVWETFWADSMREMQLEFYTKAKSIKPDVQVGFHIWHNASFNPIYRAEQDYQSYTKYSDFLKPVIYDNPAAERMASYVYSAGQNIYGDLNKEQLLEFEYSVMGFNEKSYDQIINGLENYEAQLRELPINGTPKGTFERFSSDYVLKETKRAVEGVAGSKTVIYAGLGIDVGPKNSTPESVRDAVNACFQGGAKGLTLSTSHAAMRPENISAVGATLRELGLV